MTIPGIGVLTATALAAAAGDAAEFEDGRQMSAWLGLVAAAAQHGRAADAARHQQARRPVPAHAADPRRARRAAHRVEAS